MPRKNRELLYHSRPLAEGRTTRLLDITPETADWNLLHFNVTSMFSGTSERRHTGDLECCLVLLQGKVEVEWPRGKAVLGPRASVFRTYPHALYLPPQTDFEVRALDTSEWAQGGAPARKEFPPRVVKPGDCGLEIRGGGNASRQIIDVLPPDFPADRLLVCEVLTPSGNWSSYPPHKHDEDRPPSEVKLEEVYYYRFETPDAYGFQRVYSPNRDGGYDETFKVAHGDLALIRNGYHPFVTAYGYNAYYLNFLAGERRSMAASDDPAYARFRERWPPPDPRLPILPHPAAERSGSG